MLNIMIIIHISISFHAIEFQMAGISVWFAILRPLMSLSCPTLRKVANKATTALNFDTCGNIGQVCALPLQPSQPSGWQI